jgi:hypothetical protein
VLRVIVFDLPLSLKFQVLLLKTTVDAAVEVEVEVVKVEAAVEAKILLLIIQGFCSCL